MPVPFRVVLLTVLTVCFGCAPQPSGPGAPRPTRTVEGPDPLAAPWRVTDRAMRRAQRMHLSSVLTSQVDTAVRVDSLESTLEVAWAPVPETSPRRVAGMVTAFGVRMPHDSTWLVPAGVTLPFSFVGVHDPESAVPTITTPDVTRCGHPNAAAVQGWRELWVDLPAVVQRGDAWQDSTTYVVCRDSIPLEVTTLRRFEAMGSHLRGEQQVLTLERRSTTTLRGAGRQFGEEIQVQGAGEGMLRLEVALLGGVIVAGEGHSELRLTMTGRRRQQRLVQETRVVIDAP